MPSPEGKRSMMKLAERMVSNFCGSINPSNGHQWTTLSGLNNEFEVRATLHKSTDPGQPNGVVLSAATTIWLPIPPQNVFNFFRDERTRHQVNNLFFPYFFHFINMRLLLLFSKFYNEIYFYNFFFAY